MENQKLLEKYRKKLSIYFSFFVLISIFIVVLFFDISKFINSYNNEQTNLQNKTEQVKNIIRNSGKYSELNEITFRKILEKIIKDTLIKTKSKVIVNEINNDLELSILGKFDYKIINTYLYHQTLYKINNIDYNIIVRSEMNYNLENLINDYIYFILFSFPFIVLYYYIGYFFVGKNLKPIKETITNLEDFTGNINHEFKTPLAEIISSLELSKKTGDYKNLVEQSVKSAKKLNTILDSLLGIVSLTDSVYKKERVNIIKYSKEILNEYNKTLYEKELIINIKSSKKFIIKKINKEHFFIVFSNILSNAIKYSKKNGIIDINIEKNEYQIKDYGIGISSDNLDNIFDKYFRENYTSNEGMGIGLSISKKICEINNWNIAIKSKKEKGTTVTVKFY